METKKGNMRLNDIIAIFALIIIMIFVLIAVYKMIDKLAKNETTIPKERILCERNGLVYYADELIKKCLEIKDDIIIKEYKIFKVGDNYYLK